MIDCSQTQWTCICDGEGLRWQKNNVTFAIDDEYTAWQKQLIRQAFRMVQARVRCLSFREVALDGSEDIAFDWDDIDGANQTLAETQSFWFSNSILSLARAEITFDRAETDFATDPDLFFYVAIHEILHALGIRHAPLNLPDNIMYEQLIRPLRMSFGLWDLDELFSRYCSADSTLAISAVWTEFQSLITHTKLGLRARTDFDIFPNHMREKIPGEAA